MRRWWCAAAVAVGCAGAASRSTTPAVVHESFVGKRFVSGERQPRLPEPLKVELAQLGARNLESIFKLCVDPAGTIVELGRVVSSGYPRADAVALDALGKWRFSASDDPRAAIVCTHLTFRWSIDPPAGSGPDDTETLPIALVQKRMIAGSREPSLPEPVRKAFVAAGVRKPELVVRICIDADGIPIVIEIKKSTGMPAADQVVVDAMNGWRFAPVPPGQRRGRICTARMFRWVISG